MLNLLFGPPRIHASDMPGWSSGGMPRLGRKTLSKIEVDEDKALTYSVVWCATRILAETTATLPLELYRRTSNDDREQARDHPLYDILKYSPNPAMAGEVFREGRTAHQVNWGQGFAEIERETLGDPRSPVVALWPIHPSRVRPSRPGDVDVRGRHIFPEYGYLIANNDGTRVAMRASEILHIPGALSEDGIWGKGIISQARESIGGSMAVDRHGWAYFGNGGVPPGVIYLPGMKDKEARAGFRQDWKMVHGHPDSSEIMILPTEGKYEHLSVSNEDSQFLETRGFNVNEGARWYRVPVHMLAQMTGGASFASIEQVGIEFVVYNLMPWPNRWEGQLNLKLLSQKERQDYYFEHNFAGLLRGDIGTRMAAYRTAIMIGLNTINECRRLENLNGIGPAGDVHYVPLNMTTAELMASGQAPVGKGQRGPGSDQNGAPADQGMQLAAFDRWTRARIKKSDRKLLALHLKELEQGKRESAVLPVPVSAADDQPRQATIQAARSVLVDALSRMFTKESNAAQRASTGTDFPAWLADFYRKHEATLTEALAPATSVLACAGVVRTAEDLATQLVAESRGILSRAYDSDTREQFAARLTAWPTERAARVADDIIGIRASEEQPRVPAGSSEGGEFAGKETTPRSAKAQRAKDAHKMVDKDIQRYAEEHNEPKFAKEAGGVSFPDNEAVDVAVPGASGQVAHGIELKTMVDNKHDKITMKREAMEKKATWEKNNKATFHTVVLDDQKVKDANGPGQHDDSKRQMYYRRGAGSFRVGGMHPVKDHAELKSLMAMKDKDLPPAARSTSQWKEMQASAKGGKK